MKFAIIFLFSASIFLLSCKYNNEEDLYPTPYKSCDTTNVTFNSKIIFVLANNCLSCHSHPVADLWGDGIHLETYADVKSRISRISDAINHTGNVSPMPKNGGKLNACDLKLFEIWIRTGEPN